MQDQILTFLAQGYKRSQVREILGCSDSYISEIVSENAEKLEELKIKYQDSRISARYDDLEEAALKEVKSQLSLMEIPMLLRTLEVIQKGKIRSVPAATVNNFQITKVSLSLPKAVAETELILNTKGEVVGFGEKSLAALPSAALPGLFKELKERKQNVPASPIPQISSIAESC